MSNSRRIAKNTLMLYFRQIIIMMVSLYTVRVVLNVLGAEDYGIYNVVAGVVVLFSFVNTAMASSVQRFLNYYLGKNDLEKTRDTFSISLLIHIVIALFFIIIAESVGLLFVKLKLNIPEQRMSVALIVYQFSIIMTVFSIIRIPYNAIIIAYERMSFFAWISILESILKLAVVFLLKIIIYDKLLLYSILLTIVICIILIVYIIFCIINFPTARYRRPIDGTIFKQLLSFSGWSLFGSVANICNTQGINIVLNIFTNVTVNAAMGIANQVNTAVFSFVSNFQTAFNPQLIKSYAEKKGEHFEKLLYSASKISFFLLFLICFPLYINIDFVLDIWLKEVPEFSIIFVKSILILSLIDVFNNPLYTSIQARGDVKKYNIIVSLLKLLTLPFAILFLYLNFHPVCVIVIQIIIDLFINIWRLLFCHKCNLLDWKVFFRKVVVRCVFPTIPSVILIYLISLCFQGWRKLLISIICNIVLFCVFVYFLGLEKSERLFFIEYLKKRGNVNEK